MNDDEFSVLMSQCTELAQLFPEGVVFIGGIAVYLHAVNFEATREYAEFTSDADFYISLADMADLRDIEEAVPNRRSGKHQMLRGGFAFDIYTERHSSLLVPYDMAIAYSKTYGDMRVACLEHLLVLKLEAFRDRRGSSKGDKDAKDVIRITAVAQRSGMELDKSLMDPYLTDEHIDLLRDVEKGSYAMSLARGNAVVAKAFRTGVTSVLALIDGKPVPGKSRKSKP